MRAPVRSRVDLVRRRAVAVAVACAPSSPWPLPLPFPFPFRLLVAVRCDDARRGTLCSSSRSPRTRGADNPRQVWADWRNVSAASIPATRRLRNVVTVGAEAGPASPVPWQSPYCPCPSPDASRQDSNRFRGPQGAKYRTKFLLCGPFTVVQAGSADRCSPGLPPTSVGLQRHTPHDPTDEPPPVLCRRLQRAGGHAIGGGVPLRRPGADPRRR